MAASSTGNVTLVEALLARGVEVDARRLGIRLERVSGGLVCVDVH